MPDPKSEAITHMDDEQFEAWMRRENRKAKCCLIFVPVYVLAVIAFDILFA